MFCSQHLQALSRNFYLTLGDLSRTTDLNLDCVFVKTHLFSFIQKLAPCHPPNQGYHHIRHRKKVPQPPQNRMETNELLETNKKKQQQLLLFTERRESRHENISFSIKKVFKTCTKLFRKVGVWQCQNIRFAHLETSLVWSVQLLGEKLKFQCHWYS